MVTVDATFRDGPQERQDAVTLATSSLERQVLPRCLGNSRILRFTGKRWLILWDLSLSLDHRSLCNCLSASLCIYFFLCLSFSFHSCSFRSWTPWPSHWHANLGRKCRGEETPGFWREQPWLPLTLTPHSSNSWSPPEASSITSPPGHAPRGTMEIRSPRAHVPVSAWASSQGERGGGGSGEGSMAWPGGEWPWSSPEILIPKLCGSFPSRLKLFRAIAISVAPKSYPKAWGVKEEEDWSLRT